MAFKPQTTVSATAAGKAAVDAKLFANLEIIWKQFGRQPSYGEMKGSGSAIPLEVYSERFGSWLRACEAFIQYRQREKGNMQFRNPMKPEWSGMPKQPKPISTFQPRSKKKSASD